MKHLLFCLALTALTISTITAQDDERLFKRFKGDVSFGYAKPVNSGSSGGILFAMEPKIGIVDQLYLGLRIEAAVMARFLGNDIYGDPQVEDAKGSASYVATADYYFTKNYSIRPFVGGGVGAFGIVNDEGTLDDDPVTAIKFGGLLRVGAEVKHFRFGIEYNIIPDTDVNSYDNLGNIIKTKSRNGYFGIKAGVCFGGGPRNR
jgi:outer membrane protein X